MGPAGPGLSPFSLNQSCGHGPASSLVLPQMICSEPGNWLYYRKDSTVPNPLYRKPLSILVTLVYALWRGSHAFFKTKVDDRKNGISGPAEK